MPDQKYRWDLDIFEENGEILFNYMIHNFDTMFDGKDKIKHFDVISRVYDLRMYVRDIKKKYIDDIQQELIPWIQKEFEKNDLCKFINWRAFRDPFILTSKFLGYRRLFQYKQYIFQLALLDWCHDCYSCNYCKNEDDYTECIHFYLALYGWKDEHNEKLQPYNHLILFDNTIVPDLFG